MELVQPSSSEEYRRRETHFGIYMAVKALKRQRPFIHIPKGFIALGGFNSLDVAVVTVSANSDSLSGTSKLSHAASAVGPIARLR